MWNDGPQRRSYCCNGKLVRHRRRQRRWTQENLADACHLSIRLVAKAEAGGSLHAETLERLALALGTPDDPLFPEDLLSNPKQLALEFLRQLKRHQGQVVSKCQHFLAEAIQFFMPGDPEILPFAGHHSGIEAMDRACRTFFNTIEITDTDSWRTEFVVWEGCDVVTGQWIPGQLRGLSDRGIDCARSVLIVNRMKFQCGKIISFDDYYVHQDVEQAIVEQQKLLRVVG